MNDENIKKFATDHVNSEHMDSLINIFKTYVNSKFTSIEMIDFDLNYIYLKVDNSKEEKIPFDKPLKSLSDFKDAFISMAQNSNDSFASEKVKLKIKEFIDSYNSIFLATIVNNNPVISTAPLLRSNNKFYIYISEMAEHYSSIKQNPDKVRFMIVEDESKAKSPINKKRVTYTAKARFVEDKTEFNFVFDDFIKKVGSGSGVEMIREMLDFHLIELEVISGRAYLGFGQVYLLKPNDIVIPLNIDQFSSNHKK